MTTTSGWLILLCLAASGISGGALSWFFVPALHLAHVSVVDLESTVTLGRFLRSLHYFSTQGALGLGLLHLAAVLSARRCSIVPRTWISGALVALLVLGLAFSGKVLPWDLHGGVSLVVARSFLGWGDRDLLGILLGPPGGDLVLQRVFLLHLALCGGLVPCLLYHVPLRARIAAWIRADGLPRGMLLIVALLLGGLLCMSVARSAPLGQPFSEENMAGSVVTAEWYLRWLQYLSLHSTALARVAVVALVAVALGSPLLGRLIGDRRIRLSWVCLLAAGVAVSLLPAR
jgi:hypothetical protein